MDTGKIDGVYVADVEEVCGLQGTARVHRALEKLLDILCFSPSDDVVYTFHLF